MNLVFYNADNGKGGATEIVSEEDFNRVAKAAQDVMRVYRVEEILHMVIIALQEFNSKIFEKADQGRIGLVGVFENELLRVHINQCAATFLTSLEMYQEYVQPKDGTPPFSISDNKFTDDRFEVCKAVRNYIQHVSTVGINISWNEYVCASSEKLCSFSVSADAEEMKRNKDKLHKNSWSKLEKYIDGKAGLNLYQIFNDVVDVLFDMQRVIRASKEYAVEYESSARFLSEMQSKLLGKGLWLYRFEDDDECRGTIPYLYDQERIAIDYFRKLYKCEKSARIGNFFATTAPQDMMERMVEADRIVERYVKAGGVVAEFDNGKRKITSSQFTTSTMRNRYLKKVQLIELRS